MGLSQLGECKSMQAIVGNEVAAPSQLPLSWKAPCLYDNGSGRQSLELEAIQRRYEKEQ